jgi:regulator of replication initiation timing
MRFLEVGKALDEYRSAFERLKMGKSINISHKKGDSISLNAVAKEAGKASGSLRKSRGKGYSDLCDEINSYLPRKTTQKSRISSRLSFLIEENRRLKEQNNILKSRYHSVLFSNYQLRQQLSESEKNKNVVSSVVKIISD